MFAYFGVEAVFWCNVRQVLENFSAKEETLTILEATACTSKYDSVLDDEITAKIKILIKLSLFTINYELILCILAVN